MRASLGCWVTRGWQTARSVQKPRAIRRALFDRFPCLHRRRQTLSPALPARERPRWLLWVRCSKSTR